MWIPALLALSCRLEPFQAGLVTSAVPGLAAASITVTYELRSAVTPMRAGMKCWLIRSRASPKISSSWPRMPGVQGAVCWSLKLSSGTGGQLAAQFHDLSLQPVGQEALFEAEDRVAEYPEHVVEVVN
jgi:hypothetical protein